jgi:hypothetical protein
MGHAAAVVPDHHRVGDDAVQWYLSQAAGVRALGNLATWSRIVSIVWFIGPQIGRDYYPQGGTEK